MANQILQYIAVFLAVLIVLPLHEFAHAFAAVRCGDETPRIQGRYTLNPLKHFDWIGLLMLVIARFGWAKPVPINPYNFKNIRTGYFWTSIAGVLMNLLTAFVIYPFLLLYAKFVVANVGDVSEFVYSLVALGYYFLTFVYLISLNLVIFNLIPVYPLDGFRVLEVATKRRGKVFMFLRDYGYLVLLGFIVLSFVVERFDLPSYFDPLGMLIGYGRAGLGFPIEKFWGLFIK